MTNHLSPRSDEATTASLVEDERCETRAPVLFLGLGADNSNGGILIDDGTVPARELFRCWVKLARVLCKHPGLSKSRKLMCEIVAGAVTLTKSPPRKGPRSGSRLRRQLGTT